MWTLRKGQWLNDEVINYFVAMLKHRARQPSMQSPPCGEPGARVYLHNTMFFAKLADSKAGYVYANVRRWTKRDKASRGKGGS
jgi:Ulp1 family protease